ncbi:hypothetical protein [Streptomyces flaveus]|uniref:MYXO-CTERM domain-containing protein n=1 Tax=Streptomyces flaveus TaxID=66370 RepID=A0A917QCM1_9ACTN|nr:hypothetical protein [Streptomyces flaveus]GGK44596.1 hypothetical protein GCM10010094_00420 [Streptomyces flaveus]
MRTGRLLTGTALALAAAGLPVAPAYAYAFGEDTGALEVYPSTVAPGAEVTVNTAKCGADGAMKGDASAVGAGAFTLTPSTHERNAVGRFRVPPSAQPGTYEIVARCSSGTRLTGDLRVALAPRAGAEKAADEQTHPRGSVKTGVGGPLGPDPVQTAAGVAALAVAAAGGTWLLHRRARGDGI